MQFGSSCHILFCIYYDILFKFDLSTEFSSLESATIDALGMKKEDTVTVVKVEADFKLRVHCEKNKIYRAQKSSNRSFKKSN